MWLVPVLLMCLLSGPMSVQGIIRGDTVNPEASMNVKQLIEYWGYPCEVHRVVTEDGYVLDIFRIPHGRGKNSSRFLKQVVFLQHGLLVDASTWILNLPDRSLGFILADAGYDVWLANSRGNISGRRHISLSPSGKQFWKFSFDEMAKYDLPASIDYVLQKTGQKQVYYIGHSQGTTIAFIAFSTNPQLAAKVKIFVCLAPAVTMKYTRTPLRTLTLLPDIAIKVLLGEREFRLDRVLASKICNNKIGSLFCIFLVFITHGFNLKNLNMSRLDVYASHAAGETSVMNMIHWNQALRSGKFQAYDYGWVGNFAHYKQTFPLQYDVSKMTVPTAMWNGGNDMFCDPQDVSRLILKMRNLIFYKYIIKWNHLDFTIGSDAREIMYDKILDILQQNPIL